MAVFVEMQTDSFRDIRLDLDNKSFDFADVRRPFRGIEIKDDTYAIIKAIRSDGRPIALFDSGSREGANRSFTDGKDRYVGEAQGATFNYSNFIIQNLADPRQEKAQIIENFGEPFVFFFGERPRIITVSGILLNTLDFNWRAEFWKNYEKYLRGTKLVEMDARIYLYYDDQIIEGYLLGANAQEAAQEPYYVPFNFSLFVTAHTYLGYTENSSMYPISASADVPVDDLYNVEMFNRVIYDLRERANKLSPGTLVSSIENVRLAALEAVNGVSSKATILSAIMSGLSDFEVKTMAFFNNVKTYYYGRRMVVPAGVAGAEVYSGSRLNANQATFVGSVQQRKLPLRSKISDNTDEYVGSGSQVNTGYALDKVNAQKSKNAYEYEHQLREKMAEMGVDISDPSPLQKLRGEVTNTIVKTAGHVDFAAGLARGTVGQVLSQMDMKDTPLPLG